MPCTGDLRWESIHTPDSNPHDFAQSKDRRKFTRARSGCLTCRFRRKKCDEQRPVCKGCERNRLLCSWPTEFQSPAKMNPLVSPTGRKTCRAPTPEHDAISSPCGSTKNSSGDILPLVDIYMSLEDLPSLRQDEKERSLLQHYVDSTAYYLTVGTSIAPNPFLTLVLPLAYQNNDILHVVLALGGSHLSFTNPSYTVLAKSHYAVALRGVKHRVTQASQDKNYDVLHLITLLLLLCQFEVCYHPTPATLSYRYAIKSREQLADISVRGLRGLTEICLVHSYLI